MQERGAGVSGVRESVVFAPWHYGDPASTAANSHAEGLGPVLLRYERVAEPEPERMHPPA